MEETNKTLLNLSSRDSSSEYYNNASEVCVLLNLIMNKFTERSFKYLIPETFYCTIVFCAYKQGQYLLKSDFTV